MQALPSWPCVHPQDHHLVKHPGSFTELSELFIATCPSHYLHYTFFPPFPLCLSNIPFHFCNCKKTPSSVPLDWTIHLPVHLTTLCIPLVHPHIDSSKLFFLQVTPCRNLQLTPNKVEPMIQGSSFGVSYKKCNTSTPIHSFTQ
jgi:hypothetical protein